MIGGGVGLGRPRAFFRRKGFAMKGEDVRFGTLAKLAALLAVTAGGSSLVIAKDGSKPATEPAVTIGGKIAPPLGYRLKVEYANTVNRRQCQFLDEITGMWVPLRHTATYTPELTGDRHFVSAPLHLGSDACMAEVKTINLCIANEASDDQRERCQPLIIFTPGPAENEPLSVSCDPASLVCLSNPDKSIIRRFRPPETGHVQLDIVTN